jgi:trimethylamine:corrinoid methyltransferase-like protein
VDVVAAAMNFTRNFLGQQHTRKYLRAGEILITRLAERSTWSEWDKHGRSSMADRAVAEAERIISGRVIEPLEDNQERALNEIMLAAEKELVN